MRIKEAARRTGLTEKTIRYYESRGLVLPDTEERNGRTWRDYTEAHVALLEAVATLRRAQFHVEEIDAILADPAAIPEVLDEVGRRVEEAYETLGKLRSELKRESVLSAPDMLTLAAKLKETAGPLPLPPQDLKFNFKAQDRILAEEKRAIADIPTNPLAFGWVELCRGMDRAACQSIQAQLSLFGIQHRVYGYMGGSQSSAAPAMPAWIGKDGQTLQSMQIKTAKTVYADSFTVEVRRRDEEKARRALRSTG